MKSFSEGLLQSHCAYLRVKTEREKKKEGERKKKKPKLGTWSKSPL